MRLILPAGPLPRQSDLSESSIFCVFFLIYSFSYFDIFLMSWMNANFQTAHSACPHVSRCQDSILPPQVFLGVTNILSSYLASLDFSWRVNACPWLGAPVVLFIGQWKWKKKKKSAFIAVLVSLPFCVTDTNTPLIGKWKKNKNKKKQKKCTMDALKLYVIV